MGYFATHPLSATRIPARIGSIVVRSDGEPRTQKYTRAGYLSVRGAVVSSEDAALELRVAFSLYRLAAIFLNEQGL